MTNQDLIKDRWLSGQSNVDPQAITSIRRLILITKFLLDGAERRFKQYGLNTAGFDVLATLWRLAPTTGLTAGELMEATLVTSGTNTNRVDQLVKAGFVERRQDDTDGRVVRIILTSSGLELVEKILPAHEASLDNAASILTPSEKKSLDRITRKLLSALSGPD